MTGWDFKDPQKSSYENLFTLALNLKLPPKQLDELFLRMVFNVVFFNIDDHLKNHAFIYNQDRDRWDLSPAYDITYALNPLQQVVRVNRALSIGGKRRDVSMDDLLTIAETYTVKNPKQVIEKVVKGIELWLENAEKLGIPKHIIAAMQKDFVRF